MTTNSAHRLLPWARPDGAPCYLSTDGTGPVSELADRIEEMQLSVSEELLTHARLMFRAPSVPSTEFRFLSMRLAEALHDCLRVAVSRGDRLPHHDPRDPVADDAEDPDAS
ncbi:hypothetical protein NLX86_30735 [Streptomyces sp. A3M-1-3]|uniref:hypothetical protein n=1 Tax=Streptomyces sp. A3M-1-3 TaxID=2962044 RepID=UPI0020B8FFC4|nr:hypothetical protein [Streptomyces sp. A3M-1-3]MCP3822303.1 hypothetical protein [Streptomyces sp. A3M-1-3]